MTAKPPRLTRYGLLAGRPYAAVVLGRGHHSICELSSEVCSRAFVTWGYARLDCCRCPIGMARRKRRVRIVFEAELNRLSHSLTSDLGHHAQTKIYS